MAADGGPNWEVGLLEPFRKFDEGFQSWHNREQAGCTEKSEAAGLDRKSVEVGESAASECLKTFFPEREKEGTALQSLQAAAREQRTELHQILELVRSNATHFENPEAVLDQLPSPGGAARKMSGADVVALLAELLDIASRSLTKARKDAPAGRPKKKDEDDGRGKDEGSRRGGDDRGRGREGRGERDRDDREEEDDRREDSRDARRRDDGRGRQGGGDARRRDGDDRAGGRGRDREERSRSRGGGGGGGRRGGDDRDRSPRGGGGGRENGRGRAPRGRSPPRGGRR